ncbi:MAG TPA: DUF2752 domain-containing protein [Polyangia bacterium]
MTERGAAPLALGAAVIVQLSALRLCLDATPSRAFFLGHPLDVRCFVFAAFGVPCPMCGVTRGIALALHGSVADAFRVFPAAPIAVGGLVVFGVSLLLLGVAEQRGRRALSEMVTRWLRAGTVASAAATTLVWLAHWVSVVV